ncbi:MAG: FAD-dependent oxidoreductase [Planctomycetota bacterium]
MERQAVVTGPERGRVVVLGAGFAGLVAAVELMERGEDVLVLERADTAGGLARTYESDGYQYDFGPHYITNRLAAELGIEDACVHVPYAESIYSAGKLRAFPFGLMTNPRYALGAGLGLLRGERPRKRCRTAQQFFETCYGRALTDDILAPLVSKWAGASPDAISVDFVDRVPPPTLGVLARKVLGTVTRRSIQTMPGQGLVHHVIPRRGIRHASDVLAARLGPRLVLGAEVRALNVVDGAVRSVTYTRDSEATQVACAEVLSTLPPPVLAALATGVDLSALRALRFRPVILGFLEVHRTRVLDRLLTWFPGPEFEFYRLSEQKLANPEAAPPGQTLLTVEVACAEDDPVWREPEEALRARLVARIGAVYGLPPDAFGTLRVMRTRFGYPMYDLAQEDVRRALATLAAQARGLTLIGRTGAFRYILLEEVRRQALEAARALVARRADPLAGHPRRPPRRANNAMSRDSKGARDQRSALHAQRDARRRLVEPLFAGLHDASAEVPVASASCVVGRRDPLLALALMAMIPAALVHALVGLQLDGDTYHYVEYWRKLLAGVPHPTSMHEAAPKPLLILLHGALWQATHSFQVLAWTWIALSGLAAALVARTVAALLELGERGEPSNAGRVAGRATLALLALHPLWVHQAIGGSAVTLQTFWLALAARSALRGPSLRASVISGALLMAAGLSRPDAWPIALGLLAAAPLLWATRARAPGCAPWIRPMLVAGALGAVALPMWLAFDRALTGDAWFSFRSTASYGSRHAIGEAARPLWLALPRYLPRVASNLAEVLQGGVVLAALLGALTLARRSVGALLALTCTAGAVIAFYALPFKSGLPLLPRFLVVPLVVATMLAGIGVVAVARGVRAELRRVHTRSRWAQRAAALCASVPLVLAFTGAHELMALQRFVTVRAPLDAEATRGVLEAARALAQRPLPTAARPLLVEARRKGLAVLALGVPSDAVTTLRHVMPEDYLAAPSSFAGVLYDPRDLVEPYASAWSFLAERPHESFGSATRLVSD